MATGGSDVSVDSRVVCSVCLEPYRGRQPKLLPCFHTFCLRCLLQLADSEPEPADSGKLTCDEGEDTKPSVPTINCPTCRNIIPIPPGGVAQFQSNFYVDDDADAPLKPSKSPSAIAASKNDTEEADLQEKVKAKVKVMEAALARLAEEGEEINRQKRTMDQDIQTRYIDGLCHMAEARDQCLSSLRDAAQQAHDKLEAEMAHARIILNSLSQLTVESSSQQLGGIVQTSLPNDATLRHFQQISQKDKKTYFSYSPNDSVTPSPIDNFGQFMGTVVPFGQASELDVNAKQPPQGVDTDYLELLTSASLRHDITTLQADFMKLREKLSAFETDQARLRKRVEEDVRGDTVALRNDLMLTQGELASLMGKVVSFQILLAKCITPVAFHAELSASHFAQDGKTVIFDNVVTDLGGGYDPKTGIFTTPASGVYIFMASANPGQAGRSEFVIIIDGKHVAWSRSEDATKTNSCTVHVVFEVIAGQKVAIKSIGSSCFRGNKSTYFSGVLIHASP